MLAVSWITYDPNGIHTFLRFAGQGAPDYSASSYALFVFVWLCAWGYLALEQCNGGLLWCSPGVVFTVLISVWPAFCSVSRPW
jgi:hypothetical protein